MAKVHDAARGTPPAIYSRRLLKRFGSRMVVRGIDRDVRRGECFGLLGPNGAGKTTLVETLEGLITPDSGQLAHLGLAWNTGYDRQLRELIGMQLQETQLRV